MSMDLRNWNRPAGQHCLPGLLMAIEESSAPMRLNRAGMHTDVN